MADSQMDGRAAEFFDRIRSLKPLIEACRDEAERLGRLPDPLAAAFVEHDLYRVVIPRDLGGAGLDPVTFYDLTVELGTYDGSVGWNFAVASSGAPMVGMLAPERLKRVFGVPDCAIAGSMAPSGRVEKNPGGGWRVSGRWSWMSGVHQAKWVMVGGVLMDDGRPVMTPAGMPEFRHFVLPKDPACVVGDGWEVGGMRGTGSTDYVCEGVIAEDEMSVRPFSGHANHPDPIFKPPFTFFGLGLCATALGVGFQAVEGLKQLAATKVSTNRRNLRDQSHVLYAAAKSEALLRSSQLYVRDCISAVWESWRGGETAPLDVRARARGSYFHAVEAAQEAVHLCYRAAGGSALWQKGPFERALRDVNAIGCHIAFQQPTMEEVGRVAFGLQPTGPGI